MQNLVYSFDVFDTTLTRIWANPTDLFWQLGEDLLQKRLISISSELWQNHRIQAEVEARNLAKNGEVQLSDIYQQLSSRLGWSEDLATQVMDCEIMLEQQSLRIIPAIRDRIKQLRCQSNQILFVSDMYLPPETIQGFLRQHQVWEDGDEIYVSGDVGVNKSSGHLFKHVLAEQKLQPKQLVHTGDNLHSDIRMAKELKINTQEFLETHLNRYEQVISENQDLSIRSGSLLAGACRLIRLNAPSHLEKHQKTIWNTATNVIAPVLFSYVHWCLQKAKRLGIQRLYFVARDGQVLHKIARIICENWNYDIDCRYFYGSRLAFHFPAIDRVEESTISWIFNSESTASVESFCAKVHCNPEEFADVLAQHGFPRQKWTETLKREEWVILKQVFQTEAVANIISAKAAQYRENAIAYFQQEQMGDNTKFALVDIGWSGNSQTSLSKLLKMGGLYPEDGIQGFYFGLDGAVKPFEKDNCMGYFFHADAPPKRKSLLHRELLELFVYADHPSTIAYEEKGGIYGPVFRGQVRAEAIDWGVQVQQEAIAQFAQTVTKVLQSQDLIDIPMHSMIDNILELYMFSPSKDEAQTYGSFKFSPSMTEDFFFEFAPVYQNKDFLRLIQHIRQGRLGYPIWVPAVVQRSSPQFQPIFQLANPSITSRELLNLARQSSKENQPIKATKMLLKALQTYPLIITEKPFALSIVYTVKQYFARRLV